jgi:hypothetical protein
MSNLFDAVGAASVFVVTVIGTDTILGHNCPDTAVACGTAAAAVHLFNGSIKVGPIAAFTHQMLDVWCSGLAASCIANYFLPDKRPGARAAIIIGAGLNAGVLRCNAIRW